MALIKCHECGSDVSTGAAACPKCGAKPRQAVAKTSAAQNIGIFILCGLFLLGLHTCVQSIEKAPELTTATPQPAKPGKKTEEEKKGDAALLSAVLGAKTIKKSMRDPDSLKLESVMITGSGAICYEYRARNGFNGLNVGRAAWSHDRKQFLLSEQPGFVRLWNKECGDKTGTENVNSVERML